MDNVSRNRHEYDAFWSRLVVTLHGLINLKLFQRKHQKQYGLHFTYESAKIFDTFDREAVED